MYPPERRVNPGIGISSREVDAERWGFLPSIGPCEDTIGGHVAKQFLGKHLRTVAFLIALALIGAAPPPSEPHSGNMASAQPNASLTTR